MALDIVKNYCTEFKRYGAKRDAPLDSIEIHSIGTAQSSASVIRNAMNRYNPGGIVHAVVDAQQSGKVIELLPDDNTAWADGGYGNHHSFTIEMAESDYMRYQNGAEFVVLDQECFLADIRRAYQTAVEYTALKCRQFRMNPLEKLSNGLFRVYSHYEACCAGTATAHMDPDHILPQIGKSMDDFRNEIADLLKQWSDEEHPNRLYYVQAGVFRNKHYAENMKNHLLNLGFDAAVSIRKGSYVVYCGAFSDKAAAEKLVAEIRAKGISAFVRV